MLHVAIDIETIGGLPTSGILQIGWAFFTEERVTETGEWFPRIHEMTSWQATPETLRWWLETDSELFHQLLHSFIRAQREDRTISPATFREMMSRAATVWFWGTEFDYPILCHQIGNPNQRLFCWNVMDARSIGKFIGSRPEKATPATGQNHDARTDAKLLAEWVIQHCNHMLGTPF